MDFSAAALECWQKLKQYSSPPAPSQGSALSITFPCCIMRTHNLCWSPHATSRTQTVQTTANVSLKTTSYSRCLSYMHSCKPSPALSSHLTDCRKCAELQTAVASHQKLLCCPLASNSTVLAITGQPLLWRSAHAEPSILGMLWSPFTVFKLIYSQFTWL